MLSPSKLTLAQRAAPQFIREAFSHATPEARLSQLVEVYDLLDGTERTEFVRALAAHLVALDLLTERR